MNTTPNNTRHGTHIAVRGSLITRNEDMNDV